MNKAINLRILLLSSLFFLLIFGIGYKAFEWNTLKTLAELNIRTIPEELSMVEKSNKNYEEMVGLVGKFYSEKNPSLEEQLKLLDEIDGKANLAIEYSKEYLSTNERNKNGYKKQELTSKLLLGNRGKFARQFLENQIRYYGEEIESAKEGMVTGYLVKNIFSVMRDKIIMSDYDKKASIAPSANYAKYFANIASLEKYTRSDFKFLEEDKIKNLFPYGYEMLANNRDYMSAYYSVVKDFVAGDYESASYKYSRITEGYLKLNIDFNRLFTERQEQANERARRIIEYVVVKNDLIKDFRRSNMGHYPLLPKIDGFKDDLELCQLYNYKSRLYESVLKKKLAAKEFGSLVEELSQLPPSTSSIDGDFDSSVLRFTNTGELIRFECTDKQSGKTYTFETKRN